VLLRSDVVARRRVEPVMRDLLDRRQPPLTERRSPNRRIAIPCTTVTSATGQLSPLKP
jgi:hypothetical protein